MKELIMVLNAFYEFKSDLLLAVGTIYAVCHDFVINFVLTKLGTHPEETQLALFLWWFNEVFAALVTLGSAIYLIIRIYHYFHTKEIS